MKVLNYLSEAPNKQDSKLKSRIRVAEIVINGFSYQPYCPQFIFILIALETEIREKIPQPDFYNKVFKQAFKYITDEDIDMLIKLKKEEIAEITTKDFKKENADNSLVMSIINRIEKRQKKQSSSPSKDLH